MKQRGIREVIVWLLIFVIGSLIVIFLVYPNSFQSFKSNIRNIIPSSSDMNILSSDSKNGSSLEDPLIQECISSFNECKIISNKKYGTSASLIEKKKIESIEEGEEFYNTWKGIIQPTLEIEIFLTTNKWSAFYEGEEIDFPIVLLATKIIGPEGQLPVVLLCKNDGELTKKSKQELLC